MVIFKTIWKVSQDIANFVSPQLGMVSYWDLLILWVSRLGNSYWKSPFIVDFPTKNGDFPWPAIPRRISSWFWLCCMHLMNAVADMQRMCQTLNQHQTLSQRVRKVDRWVCVKIRYPQVWWLIINHVPIKTTIFYRFQRSTTFSDKPWRHPVKQFLFWDRGDRPISAATAHCRRMMCSTPLTPGIWRRWDWVEPLNLKA